MTSIASGDTLASRLSKLEERKYKRASTLATVFVIVIYCILFGTLLLQQVFQVNIWIILFAACTIPSVSLGYWSRFYLIVKKGGTNQIFWLVCSIIVTITVIGFFYQIIGISIFIMCLLLSFVLLLASAVILVGARALPGGRFAIWSLSTLDVFIVGLLIIQVNIFYPFPNIAIEITGAFVGLTGAVALAELLKSFEERNSSNKLFDTLIEELLEAEINLENKVGNPIEIPYWTAAIADGTVLSIESKKRKRVKDAYIAIERYNSQKTPDNASIARKAISLIID